MLTNILLTFLITNASLQVSIPVSEQGLTISPMTIVDGLPQYGLFFYYTQSAEVCSSPQQIDFGFKDILIGDTHNVNWGIECSDQTQCKVLDWTSISDTYGSFDYTYMESEVSLSLTRDANMEYNLRKLDFRYVRTVTPINNSKWGVVGMSPDSLMVAFLKSTYANPALSVYYFARDNNEPQLGLMLNHEQGGLITEVPVTKTDQWVIDAQFNSTSNINLCLDFADEHMLAYNGAEDFCAKQVSNVCNNASSCSFSTAILTKAETVQLTINGQTLSFDGADYLFAGDSSIGCRLVNKTATAGCDVSFGKFAVLKYPMQLLLIDNPTIRLYEYFHYAQNTKMMITTLLGALAGLILFIVAAELIVMKLRKSEPIVIKDKYMKFDA